MYILCSVNPTTQSINVVGHVGSNKYRAVASLRKYVETLRGNSNLDDKVCMNAALCTEDVTAKLHTLTALKDGEYLVTYNNGMNIATYTIRDVEVGWIRSVKNRVFQLTGNYCLVESKHLDILPKPTTEASQHDSLMGELRGVLKSRGIGM